MIHESEPHGQREVRGERLDSGALGFGVWGLGSMLKRALGVDVDTCVDWSRGLEPKSTKSKQPQTSWFSRSALM